MTMTSNSINNSRPKIDKITDKQQTERAKSPSNIIRIALCSFVEMPNVPKREHELDEHQLSTQNSMIIQNSDKENGIQPPQVEFEQVDNLQSNPNQFSQRHFIGLAKSGSSYTDQCAQGSPGIRMCDQKQWMMATSTEEIKEENGSHNQILQEMDSPLHLKRQSISDSPYPIRHDPPEYKSSRHRFSLPSKASLFFRNSKKKAEKQSNKINEISSHRIALPQNSKLIGRQNRKEEEEDSHEQVSQDGQNGRLDYLEEELEAQGDNKWQLMLFLIQFLQLEVNKRIVQILEKRPVLASVLQPQLQLK